MAEDVINPHSPETRGGAEGGPARSHEPPKARPWQLWGVSLVILTVLSFQTAADILRTDYMWPFLDYPMYSYSRHEGQRLVVRYDVYGTTSDGAEVEIAPKDLGMYWFPFRRTFLADIFRGDREKIAAYLDEYRKRHGKEIVALRVEDRAIIVTREEINLAPPPTVVKEIVLTRPGE